MLDGLNTQFPEDRADMICYIEVRRYGDDEDYENIYEVVDGLWPSYVARGYDKKLDWIKVSSSASFFKDYEDKCLDEFRFFFVNGSLNKGGYEEIEVVPVAYVNESKVYFVPVD